MLLNFCATPKIRNNYIYLLLRMFLATEISQARWALILRPIINQGTSCVNFTCESVLSERRPISLEHANDHLSHQSQQHLQNYTQIIAVSRKFQILPQTHNSEPTQQMTCVTKTACTPAVRGDETNGKEQFCTLSINQLSFSSLFNQYEMWKQQNHTCV